MKAAQIVAPRLIKVVDAEEPQVTHKGQVKIRMERACLCGSDMPLWNYDYNLLVEEGLRNPEHQRRTPFLDYGASDPYRISAFDTC